MARDEQNVGVGEAKPGRRFEGRFEGSEQYFHPTFQAANIMGKAIFSPELYY
jgi:hypothetical protein